MQEHPHVPHATPIVRLNRLTRRASAAAALAATVLALVAQSGSAASPSSTIAVSAENAFALSLLSHLGSGNVVYSPYSIATALAMADAGAQGRTATQIDRVLGAGSVAGAAAQAAAVQHAVTAAVSPSGGPQLELANALWTQRGLPLGRRFVATLTQTFGAPPRAIDFASAPDAARQTINSWVSIHTGRLIPSVVPPGAITPATAFVLANAIYLKALWASPFAKSATRTGPFTTPSGAHVSVPFMHASNVRYLYAAGPGYQAVELPYRGSTLAALALLPTGPLAAFTRTLTASSLDAITSSLTAREVDLSMPRFRLHTQLSLNAPLAGLGMGDAFGPTADFRGITATRPLQIGLAEHAADLRVDESGTVAAGATVIIGPTAIAQPTHSVTVDLDRPFLLFLRDAASRALLFVARVEDPGAQR
jgi:serpin B